MDLARSIALSHSLLIDSGISASEKVWMNINGSLHKELARRHQNEPEVTSFRSPAEERTYAIACKILKLSDISISSNEYLLGLFESDIVIRVPLSKTLHSDHKYLIINIEVDGLHHKQSTRKRFCHLRDKYLVSKGLIVERIETLRLRNMSNKDIEEWILQIVATTLLGSTKRWNSSRNVYIWTLSIYSLCSHTANNWPSTDCTPIEIIFYHGSPIFLWAISVVIKFWMFSVLNIRWISWLFVKCKTKLRRWN